MDNKLTVDDLLKVVELYQKDLNAAIADKMVAMALLERKGKELEAVKKELEVLKDERADVNGVQ